MRYCPEEFPPARPLCPLGAARCYYGDSGGGSTAGDTNSDSRIGASDAADVVSGAGGAVNRGIQSTSGAIDASSTDGIKGNSNVITITNADADVAIAAIKNSGLVVGDITDFASGITNAALSSNAKTTQALMKGDQAFLAETQAGIGQLNASALNTLSDLAKNTTTGGLSDVTKYMIIGGVAIAIGGVYLFSKKRA